MRLGLTADLLPVVSNTGAKIAPNSTLKSLGKVPSRYNAKREAVGIARWTEHRSNTAQIVMWSAQKDYGICLQSRRIRAIDIDLTDQAEIDAVRGLIFDALGALPVRGRAGAGRCLVAFRFDEPLQKRVIKRASGIIELLADGQQFIVAGQHPCGARYEWAGGLPEAFALIHSEQLEQLWAALGGGAATPKHDPSPIAQQGQSDPVLSFLAEQGWLIGGTKDVHHMSCPWADQHSADSGPTQCCYWAAGTGGYEMGHFKCLHAHCAARTDADFLDAIGYRFAAIEDFKEVVAPGTTGTSETAPAAADTPSALVARGVEAAAGVSIVERPTDAWRSSEPGVGLTRTKKGWEASLPNLVKALNTDGFWYRVGYDAFRMEMMYSGWGKCADEAHWNVMTDVAQVQCRTKLKSAGFESVGKEIFRDAALQVAMERQFDSLQLWCGRLRWDGIDRICTFLQTYYGVEDSPYTRAVNWYWWTALAGRALDPGCQADMVPVLTGEQGLHKTRGIEALAPWLDAYTTVDLGVRDEDTARNMRGTCIQELSELRGLGVKDRKAINSFITQRRDKWVPKFMEFSIWSPRRGLMIGTNNDEEFLDDETGYRRWLPLHVTKFSPLTSAVRDQLWAQGVVAYLADGVAWEQAETLAKRMHEGFRVADSWETDVRKWVESRVDSGAPFTIRDVAIGIGLFPRELNRGVENRIGRALRAIGATRMVRFRDDGPRLRHWKIR